MKVISSLFFDLQEIMILQSKNSLKINHTYLCMTAMVKLATSRLNFGAVQPSVYYSCQSTKVQGENL